MNRNVHDSKRIHVCHLGHYGTQYQVMLRYPIPSCFTCRVSIYHLIDENISLANKRHMSGVLLRDLILGNTILSLPSLVYIMQCEHISDKQRSNHQITGHFQASSYSLSHKHQLLNIGRTLNT